MALDKERLERWRLLLGGHEADGLGVTLSGRVLAMDKAMAALYDGTGDRASARQRQTPRVGWATSVSISRAPSSG